MNGRDVNVMTEQIICFDSKQRTGQKSEHIDATTLPT